MCIRDRCKEGSVLPHCGCRLPVSPGWPLHRGNRRLQSPDRARYHYGGQRKGEDLDSERRPAHRYSPGPVEEGRCAVRLSLIHISLGASPVRAVKIVRREAASSAVFFENLGKYLEIFRKSSRFPFSFVAFCVIFFCLFRIKCDSIAVSYTHLDVYKRQGSVPGCGKIY